MKSLILSDDIRFLTNRALWETENLIKCIPDELWDKRYDGIPMWKYLYHTLYSMDRWYINPSHMFLIWMGNTQMSLCQIIIESDLGLYMGSWG